jgi:hypothetical protein
MFTHFLGDREQDQMPHQLVSAMNVGCPGEMTAVSHGMTAKAMEVKTEEVQMMIGTAESDMVQGVQSKMDTGITMMIEVDSQEMINTGNREGSGDGRDRGQWTQGMAEMKSDVEWDDYPSAYSPIRDIPWLPCSRACLVYADQIRAGSRSALEFWWWSIRWFGTGAVGLLGAC